MNIIDAHSHIWSPDTSRFPLANNQTAADLNPPTFTDEELLALAEPHGVRQVVLIQHTIYHRFDNATLLDAVRRRPDRFRAVGMIDDLAPEPGAAMRRLLPQGVTGFRITPILRRQDPTEWLASPGMHEMWRTAAETRQAMCCLINPDGLAPVAEQCRRFPGTPVVIDHLGRVGISGTLEPLDLERLLRLAEFPHVHVKVSGFYALGQKRPPYLDLLPVIERVVTAFGANRLMWGSDCPYQIAPGQGYGESLALIAACERFLSVADRTELLRGTAERVFFSPRTGD